MKNHHVYRKNLLVFGLLALAGCIKTDTQPDGTQKLEENEAQIKAHLAAQGLTAQRTNEGLYYALVKNTTGNTRKVTVGEQVKIHYVLSRLDGTKIDSSSVTKNLPDQYPWGVGLRVPGLELGLQQMNEGDKAVLVFPFTLGYGTLDFDLLPAYSPLRYDVTLLKIQNEDEVIDEYLAAKNLGTVERLSSGLRFIRTQTSTGTAPTTGQTAQVGYTGKLLTDVKFDAGTFEFALGANRVVKGFEEGVARLKVGEKAILVFPSSLGYGKDGSYDQNRRVYTIPPYAPLLFEVELKAVR